MESTATISRPFLLPIYRLSHNTPTRKLYIVLYKYSTHIKQRQKPAEREASPLLLHSSSQEPGGFDDTTSGRLAVNTALQPWLAHDDSWQKENEEPFSGPAACLVVGQVGRACQSCGWCASGDFMRNLGSVGAVHKLEHGSWKRSTLCAALRHSLSP